MRKIVILLLSLLMVTGIGLVSYGASDDVRRRIGEVGGRIGLEGVRVQAPSMPTYVGINLHDASGNPVTDSSVLNSVDIDGGTISDVSVSESDGFVGFKTNDSGSILFGSWDSGLNVNYMEGASPSIDIYNYDGSKYEYDPRARFNVSKNGTEVSVDASESYHMYIDGNHDPYTDPYGDTGFPINEDGDSITYEWTFEDVEKTGKQATHDFESEEEFEITLTVTDGDGNTHSKTKTVDLSTPDTHDVYIGTDPSGTTVGKVIVDGSEETRGSTFEWEEGSTHSLESVPTDEYEFNKWSGDLSSTSKQTDVSVDGDMDIIANFQSIEEEPTEEYPIEVNADSGGSVTVYDGDKTYNLTGSESWSKEYESGTVIELDASPDSEYEWVNWSGDIKTSDRSTQVTLDQQLQVNANFKEEEEPDPTYYDLNVDVQGSGKVDLSPSGGTYESGTTVSLTAVSESGWAFDHWEGDISGTSEGKTVTMDSNKTITAVFQRKEYTVSTSSSGNGTINLSPSGGTYESGTEVEARANPEEGWEFDYWEGDISGETRNKSFTVNSDRSIQANFVEKEEEVEEYKVNVSIAQGQGKVDPEVATVKQGNQLTISAEPSEGYIFDHWGGDASSYDETLTITVNSERDIEAYFTEEEEEMYELEVNKVGQGSVDIVGVSPQEIRRSFAEETTVEVEADPGEGYTFKEWKGPITTDSDQKNVKVLMDTDKTITAEFEKVDIIPSGIETFPLTLGAILILISLIGIVYIGDGKK